MKDLFNTQERILDIEERVRNIEKILDCGIKPQQPQPAPTLGGAVEKLVSRCQIIADDEQCDCEPEGHICGLPDFRREINNVRLALAAEKRRQELVESLFAAAEDYRINRSDRAEELLCRRVDEYRAYLEGVTLPPYAFDKERRNGK